MNFLVSFLDRDDILHCLFKFFLNPENADIGTHNLTKVGKDRIRFLRSFMDQLDPWPGAGVDRFRELGRAAAGSSRALPARRPGHRHGPEGQAPAPMGRGSRRPAGDRRERPGRDAGVGPVRPGIESLAEDEVASRRNRRRGLLLPLLPDALPAVPDRDPRPAGGAVPRWKWRSRGRSAWTARRWRPQPGPSGHTSPTWRVAPVATCRCSTAAAAGSGWGCSASSAPASAATSNTWKATSGSSSTGRPTRRSTAPVRRTSSTAGSTSIEGPSGCRSTAASTGESGPTARSGRPPTGCSSWTRFPGTPRSGRASRPVRPASCRFGRGRWPTSTKLRCARSHPSRRSTSATRREPRTTRLQPPKAAPGVSL